MLIDSLLQCCSLKADYTLMTFIKDMAPIAMPVIAAFLAYKYAIIKMKKETHVLLKRELYAKRLEAYQALWQLLAYTTNTENKNAVLNFVRNTNQTDSWFISKTNAKAYIDTLAEIFYGKGAGVFVNNTNIKALLFEYRSILYGFLLVNQNNGNDIILINKIEMKDTMQQIHKSLIELLHKEVENYPKIDLKE